MEGERGEKENMAKNQKSRRVNYSSGSKYEGIVGYSRAVRVDNLISVTGTTAFNERGEIVGVGDPCAQTKQIIKNMEKAIISLGGKISDVTSLVIYVTDISKWREIGRALSESFHAIKPCMTMVQVAKLIDSEMVVEIQADAVV
jgi:enamine deaminase RidA (YjgF/YER057c/UK114 family)